MLFRSRVAGLIEATISEPYEQDSYTFTVSSEREVRINLDSTDIPGNDSGEINDPVLRLYKDGVEIGYNDDSNYSLNSELIRVLEPGTYEVRATGYVSNTGDYRLTINGADGSGSVDLTRGEYEQNGVGAKFVNASDVTVTDDASVLDRFAPADSAVEVKAIADGVDLTGLNLSGVDAIDLDGLQSVKLDVSQAAKASNGGYQIEDAPSALMGEIDADGPVSATLDAASSVMTNDDSVLRLTIAQYKALVDEDTTLASPYRDRKSTRLNSSHSSVSRMPSSA